MFEGAFNATVNSGDVYVVYHGDETIGECVVLEAHLNLAKLRFRPWDSTVADSTSQTPEVGDKLLLTRRLTFRRNPNYKPPAQGQPLNGQHVCAVCQQNRDSGLYIPGADILICQDCLHRNINRTEIEYTVYPIVLQVLTRVGISFSMAPNMDFVNFRNDNVQGQWEWEGSDHLQSSLEIRPGSSTIFVMGVIAHECGHAWWNKNNKALLQQDPYNTRVYQEGFADLIEFRFYEAIGQRDYFLNDVLPNQPVDPYQKGFEMWRSGQFK